MRTLRCQSPGAFVYTDMSMPRRAAGQTVLRVKKLGVCGTDLHAFEGTQPYFSYPRTLGHELAAEIVETDSPGFREGELVTIIPYFHCGGCIACNSGKPNCCTQLEVCGVHIDGAMAEYLAVPSYALVHGEGLSSDALALVEPLSIGAHAVRRASVSQGEYVLVIGAGPIGIAVATFAVIAGARTIVMDVQDHRLAYCRNNLSIVDTINPTTEDISAKLAGITGGDMPATLVDATGNLKAINGSFQWFAHGGKYVLVGLQKEPISFSHPEFHKREATLMSSRNALRADFDWVIDCIRRGLVDPESLITQRMRFEDVKTEFPGLLQSQNSLVKAMIDF